MPFTVSLMRPTLSEDSRARARTSLDTTEKPLPASPARAASTEPLTASMLVCTAIRVISSTMAAIRRATPSSEAMTSRLERLSDSASSTPCTSPSTDPRPWVRVSVAARTRSRAPLALACASLALFSICVRLAEVCWVAAACWWEPWLICSTAARIWAEALESSWTVAESSSAAEAICSAAPASA